MIKKQKLNIFEYFHPLDNFYSVGEFGVSILFRIPESLNLRSGAGTVRNRFRYSVSEFKRSYAGSTAPLISGSRFRFSFAAQSVITSLRI